MVLHPKYRFELFKKIDEFSFFPVPIEVTGFDKVDYRAGLETTKDQMTLTFPNQRINAGSFAFFMGKRDPNQNLFRVDDEVKFYGYYGSSLPDDPDMALLVSARISSFDYKLEQNSPTYSMKLVNRTEELLNTLVPYSSRFNTGQANTPPTAIVQMIGRVNQFNPLKKMFAVLDSEINPITGSAGTVASVRSDGTAFETIEYNEPWKPVYYNIQKISGPEYTGDEQAGTYMFFIKYSKVLPQFQDQYGTSVNELVWRPKPGVVRGTLTEGVDIVDIDISFDVRDVQNLLIVNAGTDRNGAGITRVAYDTFSMARYGAKAGYYTRSRRKFSEIHTKEIQMWESSTGSEADSDGMPPESAYPINMSFQGRDDVEGFFTGSTLVASSKKEWNQHLRDEAGWQGVLEAQEVIQRLSYPRNFLSADLLIGSNTTIQGDVYDFVVPSFGWDGTEENPGFKLRVKEVQHAFNNNGWTTRVYAEEDERVISEFLGNVRGNY